MHYLFIDSYIFKHWFTFPKNSWFLLLQEWRKNNSSVRNSTGPREIQGILISSDSFNRYGHVKTSFPQDCESTWETVIDNCITSELYNNRLLRCVTQVPAVHNRDDLRRRATYVSATQIRFRRNAGHIGEKRLRIASGLTLGEVSCINDASRILSWK